MAFMQNAIQRALARHMTGAQQYQTQALPNNFMRLQAQNQVQQWAPGFQLQAPSDAGSDYGYGQYGQLVGGKGTIRYGVDSGAAGVAAGVTAVITVTPQERHIPRRIVMSLAVANAFIIADMRAGVEPLLSTTGSISAAEFTPDAGSAPNLKPVIMDIGKNFSMSVLNNTGALARFLCNVVGDPVG